MVGNCPKCQKPLESLWVSFEARGSGQYEINKKGEMVYEEYENLHERDEYSCPNCDYIFDSLEEAEEIMRQEGE
jgi:hypothetical protein